MPNVILYIAASLDGFIATEDGGVAWLDRFQSTGEDYGYSDFYQGIGTVIMGANTYRQELTFGEWSHPNKKVYVLSSQEMEKKPNADVEFYSGDLRQLADSIKAKTEKDIWLAGGSQVLTAFLNQGLVDEIMLFVIPVILGVGIPLFSQISPAGPFQLLEVKSYPTGVAKLHYR
ncbi:MAG TPA: dihydrofolate reductase family protein, partial [Dehalococcoidia bacterium]|nr:dihydrofolate reductase family protein [Dehalococcoidia bacterium]